MWFRRTPAGQVWISTKEYIRILEGAQKAHRLEEEIRDLRREAAVADAKAIYRRTLVPTTKTLFPDSFADVSPILDESVLLGSLPLTESGSLHVEAFVARLEALQWQAREQVLQDAIVAAGGSQ